jgi:hypothetical protein
MGFLGYSVGWRNDPDIRPTLDYPDARADVVLGGEVFREKADAIIVFEAERLKTPTLRWDIFEVYEPQSGDPDLST